MKTDLHSLKTAMLIGLGLTSMAATSLAAADFNVSAAGNSSYIVNGQADPTLTLTRGRTYSFAVNAAGHPFWIKTAAVTGTGSAYNNGVTGNGVQVGTLTFAVPVEAPDTLFYICSLHSAMRGTLNIVSPPPPPTVNILSITVTSTVTVKSTGADGWTVTPEFASSSIDPVWTAVPSFQNDFADGINTTTFDLPEAPAGIVLLRVRLDPS